jgi:tryptophan synthase alpha subunit
MTTMPATFAPSKLNETLVRCKAEGRAALIGYLPACFPTPDRGIAVLQALVEGGVDAIEVGLPYSDPVLEGPTIARSHDIALRAGSTTAHVLRTVQAIAATGVPTVVMTYWNPVERYGVERFAGDLAAAGGCGLSPPTCCPMRQSRGSRLATLTVSTAFLWWRRAAPTGGSPSRPDTAAASSTPRRLWGSLAPAHKPAR